MVLSEDIVSFGSLPVYGSLEIVTMKIILLLGNIWSLSTVSAQLGSSFQFPKCPLCGEPQCLLSVFRFHLWGYLSFMITDKINEIVDFVDSSVDLKQEINKKALTINKLGLRYVASQ